MSRVTDRSDEYSNVGSRVKWGPILAGALVALAMFFTLSLLGAALGLAAGEQLDSEELSLSAGVWSIVALAIALFVGGWIVTKSTTGENRTDAILNGMIVWGTTLSLILFLTGANLGHGADAAARALTAGNNATVATAAASTDRSDRDDDRPVDAAHKALWGAFAAALASLGAAVAGAIVGPYEVVLGVHSDYSRRDPNRPIA